MPQYQGIWTLAQAAQLQSTQRWATDPLFENTTLLLQADNAANGAQNNTFLDSSPNNFTITRNGNTTQGTFTPFSSQPGAWGNFFNSATSDFLNFTSATIGTNSFTIEAWVYLNSNSNYSGVFSSLPQATGTGVLLGFLNTGVLQASIGNGGSATNILGSNAVSTNTWHHIALVRNGSSLTLYLNGISIGTGTSSANITQTSSLIGRYYNDLANYYLNGYISNLRVVNGSAVYTSNFTPPSVPLGATSGGQNPPTGTQTLLLTCQSNRFVDNSTSPYTLTVNGTPSVQAFSPFAPQYQYTPSVTGGSGYFDGTTDFLTIANNANLQVSGNVDMFVEAFIYLNTTGGKTVITKSGITGSSYPNWTLAINTSNKAAFVVSNSGSPGTLILNLAGATTLTIGQWYHLVGTKRYVGGGSVNEYRLFVNGVLDAFNTAANISDPRAANLSIGVEGSSTDYMNGYVQSLRFSNSNIPTSYQTTSTTVGATIFTPPTAPVTTTSQGASNVQLLLNFTNAGIFDGTMKNTLETVGNAQVSTAVVKYGSGSMAFDGSGDYLIMPNALTGQFGTGDFTVEYWDRHGSQSTNYAPQVGTLSVATPSGTWRFGTFTNNGGVYLAYHNGTSFIDVQFGSALYNDNIWRHFALTRQNGTVRAFVDGVQVGTNQTITQNFNSANRVVVGAELQNPTYFNGYIDDLRITTGIARYTQNFIPPSVALPRQ